MEDQFNLFNFEDLEFQRSLCRYILETEIKPTVANSNSDDAKAMSYGICASIKGIVGLIYANSFLKFILSTNGLDQQANEVELNFFERTLYSIMNFTFGRLYQYKFARLFFNRLLNMSFQRTEQSFAIKTKRLSITYPNIIIPYKSVRNHDFTAISL